MNGRQRELYENHVLEYIWDDHDTGQDNANGNDESLRHANHAYRAAYPHYPLPEQALSHNNASSEVQPLGIWHSFMAGSTKFLALDSRTFLFT